MDKEYDMTSSHSEKEIYEGCLALMEELTGRFQEYLDFIGVDLSEYPTEEQFDASFQTTEIVERLFLWHTMHSGGTSQCMKCKELGIEPCKTIHFKFDYEDEEE